jgi:hypothetical protein
MGTHTAAAYVTGVDIAFRERFAAAEKRRSPRWAGVNNIDSLSVADQAGITEQRPGVE